MPAPADRYADRDPNDYVTLSTRVYARHAELVHRAATQENGKISDYIRKVLLPWACSDLGLPEPDLSVYDSKDLVAEAAALEGISVREFAERAVRAAAFIRLTDREETRQVKRPSEPPARKDSELRLRSVGSRGR